MAHITSRVACGLVVSFLSMACGGGSGSSGSTGPAPAGPNETGEPNELASILHGSWAGTLFGESYGGQVTQTLELRENGECDWADVHYGVEHTGWTWALSGTDSMPDWDQPWLLQLRDVPNGDAVTIRIVLIDQQAFTVREWNEGKDSLLEMLRQP